MLSDKQGEQPNKVSMMRTFVYTKFCWVNFIAISNLAVSLSRNAFLILST
jgi:hypothetical protein